MNGYDSLTRTARAAALLVSLSILDASGSSSQARPAAPPIRQIDHIMIRTGDPRELYGLFADTLQLPIAWPLTSPRAGVVTGGVGFGNVNVEAIQFPGQTDPRPRLLGLALEPSALDHSLIELNRRGLISEKPRPLVARGPDGSPRTLWTNVTLRPFSDSDNPADATIHVFLNEYSPAYVNVDERRARLRVQLVNTGGGPLWRGRREGSDHRRCRRGNGATLVAEGGVARAGKGVSSRQATARGRGGGTGDDRSVEDRWLGSAPRGQIASVRRVLRSESNTARCFPWPAHRAALDFADVGRAAP